MTWDADRAEELAEMTDALERIFAAQRSEEYVAELDENTSALLHPTEAQCTAWTEQSSACIACGLPTSGTDDLCPRCDDEEAEGRIGRRGSPHRPCIEHLP